MNVKLLIGNSAYAVIKGDTFSMDVLLAPGRSAAQSLRESAAEEKLQAMRKIERAARLEQAADILQWQENGRNKGAQP